MLGEGFNALDRGALEEAVEKFTAVLHTAPHHPLALYGLGFAYLRQDAFEKAELSLTAAARSLPQTASADFIAELYLASGLVARRLGQDEAAGQHYRRALVARPHDAQTWFNLTNLAADGADLKSAKRAAKRSTLCRATWADAWNNLGRIENDLENLEGAGWAYRRALLLEPGHRFGWNNLGVVDKKQDRLGTAIANFKRSIAQNPDQIDAWANLGRNLLLTEQFDSGWDAISHNWRLAGFEAEGGWFKHPIWDGSKIPGGKALLVWCNDKIGDEVLYSFFMPDVLAKAGRVIFLVTPRLYDIFSRSFPGMEIISWDQTSPPDYNPDDVAAFYPLDFIGKHVVGKTADFPPPRALLKANTKLAAKHKDRDPRLRIGLSWHSVNTIIGSYKSQRLEDWRAIMEVPNTRFFSLQYGDHHDEVEDVAQRLGLPVEIPDGVDQLTDIEGFSAFLSTLDLVISISSTTAHIAGAIGTPSWVMLPAGPGLSWFWFLEGRQCRWYPHTKLFRQNQVGDWAPVVARIADEFRQWAGERRP